MGACIVRLERESWLPGKCMREIFLPLTTVLWRE
jgi:hypothetical protein